MATVLLKHKALTIIVSAFSIWRIRKRNEILIMSNYQKQKERVRNEAIEWQYDFCNHDYSWGELAYFEDYFYTMGKRYGLLTEFRENGIC